MALKDVLAITTKEGKMYSVLVEHVLNEGIPVDNTLELRNISFDSEVMTGWARPGYNYSVGYLEGLALLAGVDVEPYVHLVSKSAAKLFESGIANYGERFENQIITCAAELIRNHESRRAIMNSYPGPRQRPSCISTIQFLIRNNILYTTVNMRSLDLWRGLPVDMVMVNFLICRLRDLFSYSLHHLNPILGSITWNIGSMHLYDKDVQLILRDSHYLGLETIFSVYDLEIEFAQNSVYKELLGQAPWNDEKWDSIYRKPDLIHASHR